MTDVSAQLDQLGDALQRAWREDHLKRRRRLFLRRPRRLVVVLALVATATVGGAAIAAGVLKSPADEQRGIIAGHQLFADSEPTCDSISPASFRCTLERPPTGMTFYRDDPEGSTVYRGKRYTPALDMFLGVTTQTVDSTRHVDGACVSISANGRVWNCFVGKEAVEQGLISPELLGAYQPRTPTG